MKKIKIEIWSDIVCPYCYIGKTQILQTIKALNIAHKVDLVLRSFQLTPDYPQNKSEYTISYLSKKNNLSISQVNQMCTQLEQQGKLFNINFNFEKAQIINTNNLHQLIIWAKEFNAHHMLEKSFMNAYMCEGVNLSNKINILNIVKNLNLNVDIAEKILSSNKYQNEIKNDRETAINLGLKGVPFIRINNNNTISGIPNNKQLINIFSNELLKLSSTNDSQNNTSCNAKSNC